MAVKVRNAENVRKSELWDEKDDAALVELLRRKIKDTTIAVRECESPYERSRLKEQKKRYKIMYKKVKTGSYNGDIIFNELRASAALTQEQSLSTRAHASVQGGKIYNNSYNAMDFDYETAFRKKRYYGFSLPFFLTILSLLLVASFVIGIFLPQTATDWVKENVGIDLNSYVVIHLGEQEDGSVIDFSVDDDGPWPNGVYDNSFLTPGSDEKFSEVYEAKTDGSPIMLYADCGISAIYVNTSDIVKCWFKTKMLEKVRLSFIEDLEYFQGDSYYYRYFLQDKSQEYVIKKNAEGNYDFGTIYNHIGVYGTIMFLIVAFLMSVVLLLINLIRLFTYTSRRIHGTTLFTFFMSVLMVLAPALASCNGTQLGTALTSYFSYLSGEEGFLSSFTTTVGCSVMMLAPAGICLLMLLLPFLFKNRFKKLPTRLPKGNRVHDPFNRTKA